MIRSLPPLPQIRSLPRPPSSRSAPFAASILSLPGPAQILSLPPAPLMTSLPPLATITSRFDVPLMWFDFFVPTIVAGEPRHFGRPAAALGRALAISRITADAAIAAARTMVFVRLGAIAPAN